LQLGDGDTWAASSATSPTMAPWLLTAPIQGFCAGATSAAGTVSQIGPGNAVLAGDSTYTGGTTILGRPAAT